MIFDMLENHTRYELPGSRMARGFNFLIDNDLTALPVGRIDIEGDELFVLVQEYTTRPVESGKWEAHQKYIDI